MDDAMLVKTVAAGCVRDMGSGAIRYLREMQELAASLPDAESARAWRDIEDAAHTILLTETFRPWAQAAIRDPVPLG